MKKAILIISLVFYTSLSFSQTLMTNVEGTYQIDEIDIYINGWEVFRNYDRTQFTNTIQLPFSLNEEGGQQSISEHNGIETHLFRFNDSMLFFSGNELSVFEVLDASFNVNGISIGDSISDITSQFNKLYSGPGVFKIYYANGTLVFEHTNQIISRISWSSF